ncbi:glycosyl hydrolase 108 family protein [Rhizobium leguminosarum]|uniref:glycosyl hydrolase 108 family protein n=1 Tax=Rhizobium leguminosarum TaxID=384 RepID=UPI001C975906|nr:glycosyl hydrolase 108 family protein [Rhizobium leguminosarum]MBY5318200.1 hypothetical protein [Rhizobium leguminosarum]
MRINFLPSLKLTLKSEGGDVDDKRDPGGRTSRGVIQTVYDAYRPFEGAAASRRVDG